MIVVGAVERERREAERFLARTEDGQIALAAIFSEYLYLKTHVARSQADHARLEVATRRAIEQIRTRLGPQ